MSGRSTSWQAIAGALGVLGVGGLIAWYFGEIVKRLVPVDRIFWWIRRRDMPLPRGDRFVVLVADLQGDDESKSHTRHVVRALEPYRGLDLQRIGPGPEWLAGSRDDFEAEGRKLLEWRRGDVLISGEVAVKDKSLHVRVLPADPSVRPQLEVREGRRTGEYPLVETGLPLDFDRDFDAVLTALVLSAAAPATERQGEYLVEVLEPVAGRLQQLCREMKPGLDPDHRGALWHSLGLAAVTLGGQKGDNIWLEAAIAAFRAALEVWTRERVPLDWATAQNNLGTALSTMGEREEGVARLKEAVAAFRAALKVGTRERVPLDWAMTQNNLGTALGALGERQEGVARLEEAVAAFRAALKVRTRKRVPLQWATAQNNLGTALARLGEREEGVARLEEAEAAFRAALEVRTRERVPFHWALTQENVGLALISLGRRRKDLVSLEQAVEAIGGALEVFEQAGASYNINKARRHLARAQALLAERRGEAAAK
jgi:tetratricopeptide (TPR) repeat protein